jgi:hypothetical protein
MHLSDLTRPKKDGAPYLGKLTDAAGDTHYELAISGPSKLIEAVFAKSDFECGIEPKATADDWVPRYQELWDRNLGLTGADKEPETIAALDKAAPAPATAKNSIVVSTRRTEGQGTWWWFFWPALALPTGANVFFALPPICNCAGAVVPIVGDADLFLSANSPRAPIIAASTRGGTAIDRVAFGPALCWPWQEFVPWFRINAFTTCVTGFSFTGFGVVP